MVLSFVGSRLALLRPRLRRLFSSTTSAVMTPTTSQVLKEKSPGCSTGAKAGTGVGVGQGATLAILGIGLWIFHGRKRRGNDGEKEPSELAKLRTLLRGMRFMNSTPILSLRKTAFKGHVHN